MDPTYSRFNRLSSATPSEYGLVCVVRQFYRLLKIEILKEDVLLLKHVVAMKRETTFLETLLAAMTTHFGLYSCSLIDICFSFDRCHVFFLRDE